MLFHIFQKQIQRKGNYDTAHKAQYLENFYFQLCDNMPRIEFGTWEEAEGIKILEGGDNV